MNHLEYEINKQGKEWIEILKKRERNMVNILTELTTNWNDELNDAFKQIRSYRFELEDIDRSKSETLECPSHLVKYFDPLQNQHFVDLLNQQIVLKFQPQNFDQVWSVYDRTYNQSFDIEKNNKQKKNGEQNPNQKQKQNKETPLSLTSTKSNDHKISFELPHIGSEEIPGQDNERLKEGENDGHKKPLKSMDAEELRNLVNQVQEDVWCCLYEKNWLTEIFATPKKETKKNIWLNEYINYKQGTFDLSNGRFAKLSSKQKEQIKLALSLQQIITHPSNQKKFRTLAPILENIHKLCLFKNGEDFGMKEMEWVSEIMSSCYCLVDTVLVDIQCPLNAQSLQQLASLCRYNHSGVDNTLSRVLHFFCRFSNAQHFSIAEVRANSSTDLQFLVDF